MADYRFCKVEDEGRLRIVTINRPEVLNALHSEAHWEFDGIWNEFAADPELWVGIITGAGERAFSAGNDLKVQAAGRRGPRPKTGFAGLSHRFDLEKPLIAAVNGFSRSKRCERPANPVLGLGPRRPAAWTLRSLPAEKARSPAPVMIPTQSSGSAANSFQMPSNSQCASLCSALSTSGRLIVTMRSRPSSSTLQKR